MPPGIAERRRPNGLDAGWSLAPIPPWISHILESKRLTRSSVGLCDPRELRSMPMLGANMQPVPEHFADRLFAGMADAIVYADADGVIRLWNRGAVRIFGFTESEALGQSLDIIIPETLRERHWHGYRATMRTGQSRYGDGQLLSVPAVRKDGTRISVEFTIVPFTDDAGQMIGIAAIMRDATARFEELRALRKDLAARSAEVPTQGSASKA